MSVAPRPIVPGAGRRPVQTRDDVLAQLSALIRLPDLAPVRDRLCDALGSMIAEYEFRAELSAAQADLLRATGIYLEVLGEDQGITKQLNEEDEDYRARVLIPDGVASESAIIAGVNTILSLVSTTPCRLLDAALDQWFLRNSSPVLLGIGSTASGTTVSSLQPVMPAAPAGSLFVMQVAQANGTAGDVDGWQKLGSNQFGTAAHTVYTRTASGSDVSPIVPLIGLSGDAQARIYAYRGATDGPVLGFTGAGTIIGAPTIQPDALMLSLVAASMSLLSAFGDWTVLTGDIAASTDMYAMTALDSSAPSNTNAHLSSAGLWSVFNIPLYPVGGRYSWQSFVDAPARSLHRLYESDAAFNGGSFRPNATPLGAHIFRGAGPGLAVPQGSQIGRKFLLLLPDLLGRDSDSAYTSNAATAVTGSPLWNGPGFWVAKAASPAAMQSYMQRLSDTSYAIYRAIESFVNSVAGQSIRWVAIGEL